MPLLGIVEVAQLDIGENPYEKGLSERPKKGADKSFRARRLGGEMDRQGEIAPGFALAPP